MRTFVVGANSLTAVALAVHEAPPDEVLHPELVAHAAARRLVTRPVARALVLAHHRVQAQDLYQRLIKFGSYFIISCFKLGFGTLRDSKSASALSFLQSCSTAFFPEAILEEGPCLPSWSQHQMR